MKSSTLRDMVRLMKPRLVIGIAGGSGSGKTTLVNRLVHGPYAAHISVLSHDAYFRDAAQLPTTAAGGRNWDHPEALDNALYLDHITRLLEGHTVDQPVYDFVHDCRSSQTVKVVPRPVLFLEGILLLAMPMIRDRINLRVFIDTPADLRLIRRTVRDIDERGRTARSVASQYEQTVRPMHELHVEPSRNYAHVWIPWSNENPAAVDLLTARIAAAIQETQGPGHNHVPLEEIEG
jgi:uridine kinase